MLKNIAFVMMTLFSLQGLGQLKSTPLVMVSDIEDTIKISEILDPDGAIANAPKTENVFRGMPELYTILYNNYPGMALVYLSNAADNQMNALHHQFISNNGFPDGLVILKKNTQDPDHKLNRLREIIKMTQPRVVMLVGANGENDTQTFAQITREYPQIIFLNYVRQVYFTKAQIHTGQPLAVGEMGFVTPIEIAIDLVAKRLIKVQQAQELIDALVPAIIQSAGMEDEVGKKGELSFPMWQDCRDFKWLPAIDALLPDIQRDALIARLKDRIQTRCSRPGR